MVTGVGDVRAATEEVVGQAQEEEEGWDSEVGIGDGVRDGPEAPTSP